ncbi:hypothetical protein DSECCO2_356490 [anaerobic digester metagenome]|jgi:hypothetical protein
MQFSKYLNTCKSKEYIKSMPLKTCKCMDCETSSKNRLHIWVEFTGENQRTHKQQVHFLNEKKTGFVMRLPLLSQ